MIKSIITNKHMSVSRKLYKLYLYLCVRIGILFRPLSQCTLTASFPSHELNSYKKVFRHAEKLKKKGYSVRIELLLIRKDIYSGEISFQVLSL